MIQFQEKFTGAKAGLFAAVCRHYMWLAEIGDNDKPFQFPLFSKLSPYQRVRLVRDVMVGLLCKDEPLPPGTIQHFATYLAISTTLRRLIQIEIEVGSQGEEGLRQAPSPTTLSQQEQDERYRNSELIRHRAEKNKRKLDKKGDDQKDIKEFVPEEWPKSGGAMVTKWVEDIYGGPPMSSEERERARNELGEEEEKTTFKWRCLCYDALQENNEILCHFNSDVRSTESNKWKTAITMLLAAFSGVKADRKEISLVGGPIGPDSYADESQHPRIQEVKRNVVILRQVYERTWKSDHLGEDQRCIFAVCSTNENLAGYGHEEFARDFIVELDKRGIPFTAPGFYQERYALCNEMAPLYTEGLNFPFHASSEENTSFEACATPGEYVGEEDVLARCGSRDCDRHYKDSELEQCSGCHVLLYCSRKCQKADWPRHKEHCKNMAKLRKDKEYVKELAVARRREFSA